MNNRERTAAVLVSENGVQLTQLDVPVGPVVSTGPLSASEKSEHRSEARLNPDLATLNREYASNHVQRHNMAGFRAPKLNTVRVGVIGLDNRGPNHLKALVQIGHVEIRAICDKTPAQIERGLAWTQGAGHTPEIYTDGNFAAFANGPGIRRHACPSMGAGSREIAGQGRSALHGG